MRMRGQMVTVEEPHMASMAALVLLNRFYHKAELAQWFDFRDEVLDECETVMGGLVCTYCGRDDLVREQPEGTFRQPANLATVDHVVPVSKGGERYDKGNCAVACYRCNQKKADKKPE